MSSTSSSSSSGDFTSQSSRDFSASESDYSSSSVSHLSEKLAPGKISESKIPKTLKSDTTTPVNEKEPFDYLYENREKITISVVLLSVFLAGFLFITTLVISFIFFSEVDAIPSLTLNVINSSEFESTWEQHLYLVDFVNNMNTYSVESDDGEMVAIVYTELDEFSYTPPGDSEEGFSTVIRKRKKKREGVIVCEAVCTMDDIDDDDDSDLLPDIETVDSDHFRRCQEYDIFWEKKIERIAHHYFETVCEEDGYEDYIYLHCNFQKDMNVDYPNCTSRMEWDKEHHATRKRKKMVVWILVTVGVVVFVGVTCLFAGIGILAVARGVQSWYRKTMS